MSRRREMKKRRHMAYQVRVRAIVPPMICIITPNTHPSIIIIVQKMCGFSRNAITLTDTKPVNVARNVPTCGPRKRLVLDVPPTLLARADEVIK
jgi:hypothetical protein